MKIDFDREFSGITTALNFSMSHINYYKACAIFKRFTSVLLKNPRVLHFSGHGVKNWVKTLGTEASLRQGEGDFLVFETKKGYAELVSERMLKDILKQCKTEIEVVFVSSCHSELIGEIFFKAGIDHVICIKETEKISDEASILFAKAFYQHLFTINKGSICDAYNAAVASVKFQGGSDSWGVGEHNKYILKSRHKGNEKCKIFDEDIIHGAIWDLNEEPLFKNLPTRVEHFIGRAKECQKIVEYLNDHRIISVIGICGIGKSAIVKETAHYIFKRDLAKDGIIYLSLVDCHNMENFMTRLNFAIKSNKKEDESFLKLGSKRFGVEDNISQWLGSLKGKNVILVLDNCDMIMKLDNHAFSVTIETLLHKSDKLKLIITSQVALGDIKDFSIKIIEVPNLNSEESLNVLRSKSSADITSQELLELMEQTQMSKSLSENKNKTVADHPLFQMVNGHPMALTMISTLRREMRLTQIYELLMLILEEKDQKHFTSENIAINLSMEASLIFLKSVDMNAYASLIIFALLPAGLTNEDWSKLLGNQWKEYKKMLLSKSLILQRSSLDIRKKESGNYRIEGTFQKFVLSRANKDEIKECEERITAFLIGKTKFIFIWSR